MNASNVHDPEPLAEVEPAELSEWLRNGEATLIDVREPDEYAHERIAGAKLVPLARFDAAKIDRGRPVVFMCRSGNRTSLEADRFRSLGLESVSHLKGGLLAWKAAGLPTVQDAKAPLPVMRQVQIIVGAGVLLGLGLGWFVSPWFLLLSASMAGGLLFAGVTGFCGMARLLHKLPYNRPRSASAPHLPAHG